MQTATIMIVILLLNLGSFIFLIIKLILALLGYIKSKKSREETYSATEQRGIWSTLRFGRCKTCATGT